MPQLKVMVIDDEPGIRSGIARILSKFTVDYPFMDESFRFEIQEAATGEQGIEIIEQTPPDILLLDNKLPGMQGIEVLEYIKKQNYNIIVVMITSYASLELAVKATRDGAYDFIPKPFTPQELRSSLETITKKIYLKRMTEQLKDEGKQIRFQFLSVLSHEMKAPINAIEGYLQMIRERQFGSKIEDYDQIVDRSLKRVDAMRKLIMGLLDLTKIETKKKQNLQDIDLVNIAKSAIDTMKPYAIQRDVSIQLHGPETLPFQADPDEMEIILNNLISNAIKYNKQGGQVDVSMRTEKRLITLSVTDTGIGLSKQEMAKIFNDFVRIKNEKTKHISGSGLGLSIVKKLTESYHGDINLCSVPDKGSTFTVTLPTN